MRESDERSCQKNDFNGHLVTTRVLNGIIFHFPVSEGHNRVDNRIAKISNIIG